MEVQLEKIMNATNFATYLSQHRKVCRMCSSGGVLGLAGGVVVLCCSLVDHPDAVVFHRV